jgi:hypothetical protein
MSLSARFPRPPFRLHIHNVVALRSDKEVVWPYTWRVIAFVKNLHPLWNWTAMQRP